jgi:hypothetical protein
MVRRFVHFEVLCTAKYRTVKNFCTVKQLNSISVREIRHPRKNNYLQFPYGGKIAGPGRRYLFISGLPNFFKDSFEKCSGHFLYQYLDF